MSDERKIEMARDIASLVADAILAERKRCADIAKLVADMVVGGGFGISNGPEHQQGCKDAGAWILTEIMEPCK